MLCLRWRAQVHVVACARLHQCVAKRRPPADVPAVEVHLVNADDRYDMLTDGVPVTFAWNSVNNYLVKPWVKGIVTTPQDSDFPGSTVPTSIDIDTSALPQ